jgi:hypothetical protein
MTRVILGALLILFELGCFEGIEHLREQDSGAGDSGNPDSGAFDAGCTANAQCQCNERCLADHRCAAYSPLPCTTSGECSAGLTCLDTLRPPHNCGYRECQ